MSIDSTIVLDLGSSTIKGGYVFGFPSEDEPRVVQPSAVRLVPSAEGGAAQAPTPPTTDAHAPGGELVYPVRQGVVQSWDALEMVMHKVLYEELGWVAGEEGNLMVGDPVLTSRTDRERMAQLVFESFNAAGYFVSDQAVLSLYAIGKLNGSVVDIGETTISVAPVMEGLTQVSTCRRLAYGGRDLTLRLIEQLQSKGVALPGDPDQRFKVGEVLKLKCMKAAEAAAAAAVPGAAVPGAAAAGAAGAAGADGGVAVAGPVTHTLPDGQVITIERPQQEADALIGALLEPASMGLQLPSLGEVLVTSATSYTEKDARKVLMENIFLCGGSSAAPGLRQRLLADARSVAPPPLLPALCGVPEYMPENTARVAAWMGGALLAKVVFGQGQQFTKLEYDENGPWHVNRKCS